MPEEKEELIDELLITNLDDDEDEDSLGLIDLENSKEKETSSIINLDDDEEEKTVTELEETIDERNDLVATQNSSDNSSNVVSYQKRRLKILVGNGKSGLGKSTVASQLIAPYLFIKNDNQPVSLYTMESSTDNNLFSTHIQNTINIEVKENTFDNAIINVYSKDEHAIFDIGGGKTTQVALEALKNTGLLYGIDLFVIPLTDGKHEALKAKEFYNFIKSHHRKAKIVFVLNKVASNTCYEDVCLQYIDFLGDRNLLVDATRGVIEDIEEEDRNLVHLQDDDIIKYSVREEVTVFELAHTDMSNTERLLREAIESNDMTNTRYLSARKKNVEKAKVFYSNFIEPSLATFDKILD